MSFLAALCHVKGESTQRLAAPSAAYIRGLVAEHEGFGLVEPDLPIGKLALPRDPVDRAVLAIITRGAPRFLLFVRGERAKLAKVKEERVLDHTISLVTAGASEDPLIAAAWAVLSGRGIPGIPGKELLREARSRRGGANTQDAADLGRALVRAWSAGLIEVR